jgi:protein-S-isoprenylcysteine O-methyltransferase Ste14
MAKIPLRLQLLFVIFCLITAETIKDEREILDNPDGFAGISGSGPALPYSVAFPASLGEGRPLCRRLSEYKAPEGIPLRLVKSKCISFEIRYAEMVGSGFRSKRAEVDQHTHDVGFDHLSGLWTLAIGSRSPAAWASELGLMLYLATSIWQVWTDVYLARFFNGREPEMPPMTRGPYRYVRHPRYSATIIAKVALALTLASIFGWLLAVVWSVILLRQIGAEELHLKSVFGSEYEAYSHTTARVIPGIY